MLSFFPEMSFEIKHSVNLNEIKEIFSSFHSEEDKNTFAITLLQLFCVTNSLFPQLNCRYTSPPGKLGDSRPKGSVLRGIFLSWQ